MNHKTAIIRDIGTWLESRGFNQAGDAFDKELYHKKMDRTSTAYGTTQSDVYITLTVNIVRVIDSEAFIVELDYADPILGSVLEQVTTMGRSPIRNTQLSGFR